jgi:hypothetical protein
MRMKELFPAFAQDDFLLLHSVNFHVKDGHQPKISDRADLAEFGWPVSCGGPARESNPRRMRRAVRRGKISVSRAGGSRQSRVDRNRLKTEWGGEGLPPLWVAASLA